MTRLLMLLVTLPAFAAPPDTRPGENLARGKPYTMGKPNYHYCTEPGDKTQLTDGVYTQGYFWTQKATVGWSGGAPQFVTIDLGADQPIRGVSWSTAAGVAGVQWPEALIVFVSQDGKKWHEVGDLVQLSARKAEPPKGKYGTHVFWTDALATHGRHVQVAAIPRGPYLFVDEIEVFKGDDAFLGKAYPGKGAADVKAQMRRRQFTSLIQAQLRRDLAAAIEDLAAAPDRMPAGVLQFSKAQLTEKSRALAHKIDTMPLASPEGFRAVLPMTDLEREIFWLQSAVWRLQGKGDVRVWKSHRWDPLAPSQEPPQDAPTPELSVSMMSHEVRADVLNLTNALPADSFSVSVTGLPGGTNPPYVSMHEVRTVGTRHFVAVSAALQPPQRGGRAYGARVPLGMTRQLWFSFAPKDVPPGIYEGQVVIHRMLRVILPPITVPIRLRIYPLRFPNETSLLLGGWSYTNAERQYGVTPANRDALIAHLREHGVNTPWATRAATPWGKYDDDGNLTQPPDTANFDAWVKRWPDARRYMIFVAIGSYRSVRDTFLGSRIGTPAFERKVGGWIGFWADHVRKLGLKPSQLGLLLVDEPNRKEQFDVTTAWAKAIHKAEPDVLVWVDAVPRELETCREMMGAVNVLVPNRAAWLQKGDAYKKLFLSQRERGCELGFYSCAGPARTFDPYSYYLLQQWHVFAIGGRWAGFWAFGDTGRVSCWNEYVATTRGPYCPLYLDDTTVTGAKYMEAIREGVEDYEYLVMLRDRIAALARAKPAHPKLAAARALLAAAPDRVLHAESATKYRWDAPKDRALADQVRVEILEMLTALEAE